MKSLRAFAQDLAAMKHYIFLSFVLFAAGVVYGYGSETLDAFMLRQIEPLRDLAEQMDRMENAQLWMFLFIFFNNFLKSILVVILGAALGLFPIIFLVINGLIIGYVVSLAGEAGASVFDLIVRGLLPHGVLEVTAIVIAAAFGIRYGVVIVRSLTELIRGKRAGGSLRAFHGTLKRLIAFLFLSLLAAAFIESTVTYFLVRG